MQDLSYYFKNAEFTIDKVHCTSHHIYLVVLEDR